MCLTHSKCSESICSREEEKNKGGEHTTQIEIQARGVKDGLTGLVCDLEKG